MARRSSRLAGNTGGFASLAAFEQKLTSKAGITKGFRKSQGFMSIQAKITPKEIRANELAKSLGRPLREMGVYLASAMRARVAGSGQAATGSFRTYATKDGGVWVKPLEQTSIDKQAAGRAGRDVFEVKTGAHAGWIKWASHKAYMMAHSKLGRPKRYQNKGTAWRAFQVRQINVRTVRLDFRGTHKKSGSARSIGANLEKAQRNETKQMLYPSRSELDRMGRILRRRVNDDWIQLTRGGAGRIAESQVKLSKQISGTQRRASRLLGTT